MKDKDEKSTKKLSSEIDALIARERAALESINPRLADGDVPSGELKRVILELNRYHDQLPGVFRAITVYKNGDDISLGKENAFTRYVRAVEQIAETYNAGIEDCKKAVYNKYYRDINLFAGLLYDEGWLHENEMLKRLRISVIRQAPNIKEDKDIPVDIKDIFPDLKY